MAQGSSDALEALALASRQLQEAGPRDQLLRQIVDIAVATIGGCDYAGVSMDRDGRVTSPVVSDQAVLEIDSLQYAIDVGPCLTAMRGLEPLVDAPDLEQDARFVPFGAEAAKQGCRSVLAGRLYVDGLTLGSLNLYGSMANAFSDDDRRRSIVLSALASLALNVVRLEFDGEGLRQAVRSRDVIGQAKGILMERDRLTADAAFAWLQHRSQTQNRKLRDVAEQLVAETESHA